MLNFALDPGAYHYRPLYRTSPEWTKGWDVFALQTGLKYLGYYLGPAGTDGYFGADTQRATKQFQTDRRLTADGIAGVLTQAALALAVGIRLGPSLPSGLLRGVFTFEGGNQVGNHTPPYTDKSRDFGIVQDNLPDDFTNRQIGFDLPGRIEYYTHETVAAHARYAVKVPDPRAWELAIGHWNRPAWTDKLAAGGTLTPSQSDWIEGYIDRLTTYVVW